VSVLMGVLLCIVGAMTFAMKWISAAWLRHLKKSRPSSSSSSESGCGGGTCTAEAHGKEEEDVAEKGGQGPCTRCDTAMLAHGGLRQQH
jgi:hypothetical protein